MASQGPDLEVEVGGNHELEPHEDSDDEVNIEVDFEVDIEEDIEV